MSPKLERHNPAAVAISHGLIIIALVMLAFVFGHGISSQPRDDISNVARNVSLIAALVVLLGGFEVAYGRLGGIYASIALCALGLTGHLIFDGWWAGASLFLAGYSLMWGLLAKFYSLRDERRKGNPDV